MQINIIVNSHKKQCGSPGTSTRGKGLNRKVKAFAVLYNFQMSLPPHLNRDLQKPVARLQKTSLLFFNRGGVLACRALKKLPNYLEI